MNAATVDPATAKPVTVDVVIPYYRDQRMLDRILAALRHQTGLAAPPRVIVADDGSPTPPAVPAGVTVVRQDDRGFRASAARHLGAGTGDGEVLLFLDGDTVPGPDYVAALLAALDGNPDLLVVGRRRYGRFAEPVEDRPRGDIDLDSDVHADIDADTHVAEVLPDPDWPAAFYAETDGLTRGEGQSGAGLWRGVLSAVFGLHRRLYDVAGGFDPDIVGYGGEDWDLAWRCEQVGGRFRYVPEAVAWHDGPDWGGRAGAGGESDDPEHLAQKNAETARLAPLIANPLTRPAGGIFALPLVAVHIHAANGGAGFAVAGTGAVAATCASLLHWADVAVTVDPATAGRATADPATSDAAVIAELFAADPRVRLDPRGPWWEPGRAGAGPRRRPEVLVDIHRPCTLGALGLQRLRELCPSVGSVTLVDEGRVLAQVRSSRALAREQVWGVSPGATAGIPASEVGVRPLGADGAGVRLERVLGGW
ncbi:glycosyltransferase [Rhodococcus sp. IEGM 1408]|uniref:glycosyltransferase n=1 Tax=Rhodococcus sp. IEGM 1408 TaxID=3082220 RepID=UPI00295564ED|nr:glycosyltransferase [Rhodococcus sp. IEGM 1408]MDV7999917.1 glycosyltransferase [Rhodococcus sp. IEGM 1408]